MPLTRPRYSPSIAQTPQSPAARGAFCQHSHAPSPQRAADRRLASGPPRLYSREGKPSSRQGGGASRHCPPGARQLVAAELQPAVLFQQHDAADAERHEPVPGWRAPPPGARPRAGRSGPGTPTAAAASRASSCQPARSAWSAIQAPSHPAPKPRAHHQGQGQHCRKGETFFSFILSPFCRRSLPPSYRTRGQKARRRLSQEIYTRTGRVCAILDGTTSRQAPIESKENPVHHHRRHHCQRADPPGPAAGAFPAGNCWPICPAWPTCASPKPWPCAALTAPI